MKLKRTIFLLLFSALACSSFAQLKWTAFIDLNDSLKQEAKPLLIFLHTDWCKICKMQENVVFADLEIAELINQNVYALKLNAESEKEIRFLGKLYQGANSSSHHELAIFLGSKEEELSFPTTILINQDLQPLGIYNSYLNKEKMKELVEALSN